MTSCCNRRSGSAAPPRAATARSPPTSAEPSAPAAPDSHPTTRSRRAPGPAARSSPAPDPSRAGATRCCAARSSARSGRKQQLTFVPVEADRLAYGLGVTRMRSPELGTHVLGHDGALPGFGSSLWHLPANGITAAVLANDNDSSHATRRIAAVLIKTATEQRSREQ